MEANEIFRLGLLLVLAPVIVTIGRKVPISRAGIGLGVAYVAIIVKVVSETADEFGVLPTPIDFVGHLAYAVAGMALLFSALALRRHVLEIESRADGHS